eukprot:g27063.t1
MQMHLTRLRVWCCELYQRAQQSRTVVVSIHHNTAIFELDLSQNKAIFEMDLSDETKRVDTGTRVEIL